MRKIIIFLSSLLFIVGMTACSQSNNETDKEDDNNTDHEMTEDDGERDEDDSSDQNKSDEPDDELVEEAGNQDDMRKMMEELDLVEIEVEISYGKDKEYEAEIEHHDNGDIESEVEDEINDEDIDDDLKAFNNIYPKVKKLNVSKDMDKQDVIDQFLEAFELDSDYEKFEVEFTFDDGTKLSYED